MKKRKGEGKPSTLDALKLISQGVKGMVTVNHLEEERFIPTLFTSYNRMTGLGGHPLRRLLAVHGKNQTGKSVLAIGIAESCRRHGHVPIIYEAEWSAEKRWMNNLIKGEAAGLKMPGNLDELIADMQQNLVNLAKAKKDGDIEEDIGCCFVVDTLTKLIPREQLETILEKGISKGYSMQAQWISIWSKIIVPQIYRSNSSLIIVLQERQNIGAPKFAKQRKVTLGEALLYDVSQRIECTYSKAVERNGKVVAHQFFYCMEKNKSDGNTSQEGSFFTSTGEGDVPPGFDVVREALEEATVRKVLRSVKRDKKDWMVAEVDGKEILSLPGGTEDIREYLVQNKAALKSFVDHLNDDARRMKS